MTTAGLHPPVIARHMLWAASILLGHSTRWHRPTDPRQRGFARNENNIPVWASDAFAVAWSAEGAIWRAGFEAGWLPHQRVETPKPLTVQLAELWLARGIDRFWQHPGIGRSFFAERPRRGEEAPPREEITADRWFPPAALISTFEDFASTTHADLRRAFELGINAAERAIAEATGDPLPPLLPVSRGAKAA